MSDKSKKEVLIDNPTTYKISKKKLSGKGVKPVYLNEDSDHLLKIVSEKKDLSHSKLLNSIDLANPGSYRKHDELND